jgi:hypothetical protein
LPQEALIEKIHATCSCIQQNQLNTCFTGGYLIGHAARQRLCARVPPLTLNEEGAHKLAEALGLEINGRWPVLSYLREKTDAERFSAYLRNS